MTDVAALVAWVRRFAELVDERADELSALDAAIGDADHGTNLRRGCTAAVAALDADPPADVAAFGRTIGMKLISTIGGASGVLYGSFFLAFGQGFAPDASGFAGAFRAGVDSVVSRGKASPGDKTMIDALLPAAEVLERGGSPAEAADAAEAGMRATVPMVARKGRASYLGERSAGHQDPGATSSWLLVSAAAATLAP